MPLFYMQGMPIGGVAIMLALVASIGGFIFGYDTGQISDILIMDDFRRRFGACTDYAVASTCEFTNRGILNLADLQNLRWRGAHHSRILPLSHLAKVVVSANRTNTGTLAGALAGAIIADFLGRRWAMISESLLVCVGLVIQMTAFTVWQQVAVGRFVAGLGIGALSAAVPMYQAETAPIQLRGTLTATYQLFITAGILAAYAISTGTRYLEGAASWETVIGPGFVWPAMLIFGIFFMPESPRWLAAQGRNDDVAKAVARTYGIPASQAPHDRFVQAEVEEIFNQLEAEKMLKSGWIDCFRAKNQTLYRTLLGMTLQSLRQLTGANFFFYYGASIFRGVADSFISQLILGAVNLAFGRRLPLIFGGIWQSIWLFVFAAAGTAGDPSTDQGIGKLMITSACLFILGFAMSWAPGIWIIIGETFPPKTRAKQGALSTTCNWVWNFLIAFFTPLITGSIGFRYGFVFAACNLAGAVIVYLFLYESSNLSLESVDNMYNDPECKPWSSRKWAPAGYKSRFDLVEQTKAAQARKPLAIDTEKQIEHAGKSGEIATQGPQVGAHDFEGRDRVLDIAGGQRNGQ
ncbi:monosaccharide transporter [Coprinopsis sp. MPI-PUGE-AT-0042]|nr:monosaccharide transporter [Coprinopsis sp. MPI-PUGE-AT-0042]